MSPVFEVHQSSAMPKEKKRDTHTYTCPATTCATSCLSGPPQDEGAEDDLEDAECHRYPGVGDNVGAAQEAGADGRGQLVLIHLSVA